MLFIISLNKHKAVMPHHSLNKTNDRPKASGIFSFYELPVTEEKKKKKCCKKFKKGKACKKCPKKGL
ncbi:MAG: hypothetical protein DWQ02_00950 [Bacteroidetes bacterium]|nr:MAG: hypothetical protein DWQ02_00950 [Bacteroidota bacterium]